MKDNVYTSKQTDVYASKQDNNKITIDLNTLSQETTTISIRVPVMYKVLYKKMSATQKSMFKIAIISLLEAIVNGKADPGNPIILNMNVNMNSLSNENNIMVNLSLKEALEELFGWLDRLASPVSQYSKSVPLFVKSDAAKYRAKVARLLREVN